MKRTFWGLLMLVALIAGGCGAGGELPKTDTTTGGTTTGGTTTGGTTTGGTTTGGTTPAPSMTIALTDSAGAATTSTPATVKATVKDAAGNPVPSTVVTFKVNNSTLATLVPAGGTALTNASGIASVSLTAASVSASGATTVAATAQVGTTSVTASTGFAVNATPVTITAPVFGVNPLSAYGTTSMSVTVTPSNTPLIVTFTSLCAGGAVPKAVISTSVPTVNGVATGSYLDNGCAGTDTITAAVSGIASASSDLVVTPPATGSLKFVSATPANISLQGTGGTEASQVVFKVLDSGGNGLSGKMVTFGLSTSVGGITLTPAPVPPATAPTAISDSEGLVTITVNAGTVSTPVRVTASTPGATSGPTLTTQSNQLTITTGIPDQDSFSLAATKLNMEGWNVDGNTAVLTARLSDHFNNPVPDGTAVNFTTEGGSIVGSCSTVDGACSSTFTSQNPRPSNGRVTVLAYAVGEESFTDLNGNGVADLSPTNEMIDANGVSTDMAEAYVDYNENGVREAVTEPFIDFDLGGTYSPADGQYNGVLCNTLSSAGTCGTTKTIHVRESIVITMSSSSPAPLALFDPLGAPATFISLPSCSNPAGPVTITAPDGPPTTYAIRVVDENGNAMPVGTTISFTTGFGIFNGSSKLLFPAPNSSIIVPNTSACSSAFPDCPASAASVALGIYSVTLQSDATYSGTTCSNPQSSGLLTVTVTTPDGLITSVGVPVID